MSELLYKKSMEIINDYYPSLLEEYYQNAMKVPQYIFNHIFRIVLQVNDTVHISKMYRKLLEKQLPSGGWGSLQSNSEGLYGITATALQLLFWTIDRLRNDESSVKIIEDSIARGIDYLLRTDGDEYWVEKNSSDRKHGILDLNHYILQCLYYALNYENGSDKKFQKGETAYWYDKLSNFYLRTQEEDGGWHEIGKPRSRVGTTSDALRALLPNKKYVKYIGRGILFIIHNQNPYYGYWDAGNLDKCFDASKALINSVWANDNIFTSLDSIDKGLDYILTYDVDRMNFEEKCDLMTIFIDYVDLYKGKKYFMAKKFF